MEDANWRKRLNIGSGLVLNYSLDNYLKNNGFYESNLSPRFMNDESHYNDIIEHDAYCLRLDAEDPKNENYTMRIFITDNEIYMEVQNSWRGFDRSYHSTEIGEEELSIKSINRILNYVSSL